MEKHYPPKKILYYRDEHNDDFSQTVQARKPLPANYRYVHDSALEKALGFIAYRLLLTPLGWLQSKLFHHHKFIVPKEVKALKTGFFLYGNHTALFADVFLPSLFTLKRKTYLVAGEQAKSLTWLLPVMRAVGCVPLPDTPAQGRELLRCMQKRLRQNAVVLIRPEAHVWPYYTGVREFPAASFKYPALCNAPVVCMTSCYQKRRLSKRPKMVTFLDGPFYPDPAHSTKDNAQTLRDAVYQTMCARTREHSTYAYYEYRKLDENEEKTTKEKE